MLCRAAASWPGSPQVVGLRCRDEDIITALRCPLWGERIGWSRGAEEVAAGIWRVDQLQRTLILIRHSPLQQKLCCIPRLINLQDCWVQQHCTTVMSELVLKKEELAKSSMREGEGIRGYTGNSCAATPPGVSPCPPKGLKAPLSFMDKS